MSLPVIATITLFYSVGFWNNYFAGVLYITTPKLKPLQQYMYDLITMALNTTDATGNISGDINSIMNLSGEMSVRRPSSSPHCRSCWSTPSCRSISSRGLPSVRLKADPDRLWMKGGENRTRQQGYITTPSMEQNKWRKHE
jgi:hypothetical protein